MKTRILGLLITGFLVFSAALNSAWGHCEIPCGIYDDQMRADMIAEHATTIEKAMQQIEQLGQQSPVNYNQLVRWITNKDHHATEIQTIVSQYFLTQRIKTGAKDYEKKLGVLHRMLVSAMKCKQTTDLENVKALRAELKEFDNLYFGHSHRE